MSHVLYYRIVHAVAPRQYDVDLLVGPVDSIPPLLINDVLEHRGALYRVTRRQWHHLELGSTGDVGPLHRLVLRVEVQRMNADVL